MSPGKVTAGGLKGGKLADSEPGADRRLANWHTGRWLAGLRLAGWEAVWRLAGPKLAKFGKVI